MSTKVLHYSLTTVQVTIGSFRVDGWADDDAAALTPMGDLGESKVSADGSVVVWSRNNDPRWELTLTVRQGTAAYRQLAEAIQDQLNQSDQAGAISPLPFQLFDEVSGDKFNEPNMLFAKYPDLAYGKVIGDAEFQVLLPSPNVVLGANVTIAT